MVPIVMLCGNAGSGKDTVGNYLVSNHGAVCIAHADPIKRICKDSFNFTDQQLWGESQFRNEIDHRILDNRGFLYPYRELGPLLAHLTLPARNKAKRQYEAWFMGCLEKSNKGELTPRLALQTLGTEWGRNVDQNLWNRFTIDTAFQLLSNSDLCYTPQYGVKPRLPQNRSWESGLIVITDGRFRNEILGIQKVGGIAVKIERSQIGYNSFHTSETELKGIPLTFFEAIIENNDSLDFLRIKVDQMVSKLLIKAVRF